jgi:probable HAF family extracellular repeat protein
MRSRNSILILVCVALLIAVPYATAQTASFTPLGLGPNGVQSQAWDTSANGSVVVGTYYAPEANGFSTPPAAFRWEAGVLQDLGALNPNARETQAFAVSDDGTKVVGVSRAPIGYLRPFLWTAATGMVELSNVPGTDGQATGISPDGNTIVGYFTDSTGDHAFTWNAGVVKVLPELPAGSDGRGFGICGAGVAFVGSSQQSDGTQRATLWNSAGSIQALAQTPGSMGWGQACSNNAGVVVGSGMDSKGNLEAARWNGGALQLLGALGGTSSNAEAVSADGSVIIGSAGLPFVGFTSEFNAFRYRTSTGKMEQLSKALQAAGVGTPFCHQVPCAAGTWFLQLGLGVSADGNTIVGMALGPDGNYQAFRAFLPLAGTTTTPSPTPTPSGACPTGFAQVTVSVKTASTPASVSSLQASASGSKLTVASGQTGSACFQSNKTLGFAAANNRRANWGGTPTIICKNGATGQNQCEFQLGTATQSVTSTLQ